MRVDVSKTDRDKARESGKLASEIRKSIARIGKERDKLRDLISDAESNVETCDRALEALNEAVDAISEYA